MCENKYKQLSKIYNRNINNYIPNSPQLIYHYTSPEGLNSIISKCTLRFTDRNYLNDYSEGRYIMEICKNSRISFLFPDNCRNHFMQLCREMLNNPLKKKVPTFQCSFSVKNDVLPLWNYYSKSEGIRGYNLCFSSDNLIHNVKTSSYEVAKKSSNSLPIFGGKVIYNEKKQKDIIKKIVTDFTNIISQNIEDKSFCFLAVELLVDKLLLIGSFFKPKYFKHEEEYRLLIKPILTIKDGINKYYVIKKEPESTVKNGLIIPHIDLKFDKFDLQEISISPTLNFEETKCNLINALKMYSYNYENIKITKSNIPVRF